MWFIVAYIIVVGLLLTGHVAAVLSVHRPTVCIILIVDCK